jgi:hypothetical protein
MIFDVKMEYFRRTARFVAGGHTTDTPHAMTYASVVSREPVRVALTLAALNDLDVNMADIENAYLTAPITEKVWTVLVTKFGDGDEKRALIARALYCLKSAGAAFSNHFDECMKHLGWNPCRADRDLLMKAETRPDDGVLYWAYILIYVDDILCVHNDPGAPLTKLDEYFKIKEGSIQVPTFYLGAKMKKTVLPNGVVAWGMSSSKYVQSAIHNVQDYLTALPGNQKLLKKASGPFAGGYKPELDESPELAPQGQTYISRRFGLCAGVWSWDALASSLRCQCCPHIFVCRVKATCKLSSMCLHTWDCITIQELCLIPHTPLLTWVPLSRLIGSLCMVM